MLEKFTSFFRIMGGLLVSLGLVRDVFGDIILQPGFAEGRFSADQVGQALATVQLVIFRVGIRTGLLSVESPLTMFERRIDAEFALLGFFLLVIAGLLTLVARIRARL